MRTRILNIDWLIPFLGIALVAGTLMAATTYFNLEQKTHSAEALTTTLDRLYQEQQLSVALKTLHEGKTAVAAQRLDLLLCQNILQTNAALASADTPTRAWVQDAFRRIALIRPKTGEQSPGSLAQECSGDQVEAERILAKALAETHAAQAH